MDTTVQTKVKTPASFYSKIIEIQKKLKAPKNQYNSFGKYSYRSCEDILEALKPLLAEQNLILTLSDEIIEISGRFYVKATATITDGVNQISNSAYAREELEKKGMDGSQITGASSSYARKYALNGLFLIDDTKDSDYTNNGNGSSQTKNITNDKKVYSDEQLANWYKKIEQNPKMIKDWDKTLRFFKNSNYFQKVSLLKQKYSKSTDNTDLVESLFNT